MQALGDTGLAPVMRFGKHMGERMLGIRGRENNIKCREMRDSCHHERHDVESIEVLDIPGWGRSFFLRRRRVPGAEEFGQQEQNPIDVQRRGLPKEDQELPQFLFRVRVIDEQNYRRDQISNYQRWKKCFCIGKRYCSLRGSPVLGTSGFIQVGDVVEWNDHSTSGRLVEKPPEARTDRNSGQ